MDRVKRKHLFQIRKMPLKKIAPEKTPELYALDVHSICLPIRKRKSINWSSIHCEVGNQNQQDLSDHIIYSQAYQELYQEYIRLGEQRNKIKAQLQNEIENLDSEMQKQKNEKKRLSGLRDGLYNQIQTLRDQLTQQRDKNYNLRWELYHQRGAYMANIHGYSFLQPNQMTYQELLQMQEQMGSVNKGLTLQQIQKLQKIMYKEQQEAQREICCVCYDQIETGQWVTVLKCKHNHHCDCLKDWLVKQKVCPICKQEVVIQQNQLE